MLEIEFVLISEGPSEAPLVPHLERLCVESGASEATGSWFDFRQVPTPPGKSVEDQLGYLIRNTEFDYDVVFVHRDPDSRDDEHIRDVIRRGIESVRAGTVAVPVVPIQALEAWLLVDPIAIRRAVGNPRGPQELGLPRASRIEAVSEPKAEFRKATEMAAEETGSRRKSLLKRFGKIRRALLEQLDPGGPISQVPSWQRLVADVEQCVSMIRRSRES